MEKQLDDARTAIRTAARFSIAVTCFDRRPGLASRRTASSVPESGAPTVRSAEFFPRISNPGELTGTSYRIAGRLPGQKGRVDTSAYERGAAHRLARRRDSSPTSRNSGKNSAGTISVKAAKSADTSCDSGIMESVGTFTKGDDCVFQLTRQGWERREEFQRPLRRLSASAISRSLSRAFSRIVKGVSAAR
jgi:hypothetical protein